jgi:hypothetical protein
MRWCCGEATGTEDNDDRGRPRHRTRSHGFPVSK